MLSDGVWCDVIMLELLQSLSPLILDSVPVHAV